MMNPSSSSGSDEVTVSFRPFEEPNREEFRSTMGLNTKYEDVILKVADKLGASPSHLQLRGGSSENDPKPTPFIPNKDSTLKDMGFFSRPTEFSLVLFFEILELPLREYEKHIRFVITWHNLKSEPELTFTLLVPRGLTFKFVVTKLQKILSKKLASVGSVPSSGSGKIRLLYLVDNTIHSLPEEPALVETHFNHTPFRAEEIPKEELGIVHGFEKHIIKVCHFTMDNRRPIVHGNPFLLLIQKGEKLPVIKERIQRKLGLAEGIVENWKYAFLSSEQPPEYLEDNNVVIYRYIQEKPHFLGLEHPPLEDRNVPAYRPIVLTDYESPEEIIEWAVSAGYSLENVEKVVATFQRILPKNLTFANVIEFLKLMERPANGSMS
eukprot:TRINITY_DN11805_c0_g1_i1.p1 TRINITY_DN11805_c0_g1~~TRINITY_DN11805_c0_g1_i1.p1  ORF type:complete len:380 (-),score=53.60 TRINITY_DN11805_c0_g1_i1:152-1291(-)